MPGGGTMSKKRKAFPLSVSLQLETLVCFNHGVRIVTENSDYCRLRVKLRHSAWAKLYGKFFPLREYHDTILEGIGMRFFLLFKEKAITLETLIEELCSEHRLSFYEGRMMAVDYIGRLMRRGIAVVEIPGKKDGE